MLNLFNGRLQLKADSSDIVGRQQPDRRKLRQTTKQRVAHFIWGICASLMRPMSSLAAAASAKGISTSGMPKPDGRNERLLPVLRLSRLSGAGAAPLSQLGPPLTHERRVIARLNGYAQILGWIWRAPWRIGTVGPLTP